MPLKHSNLVLEFKVNRKILRCLFCTLEIDACKIGPSYFALKNANITSRSVTVEYFIMFVRQHHVRVKSLYVVETT